MPIAPSDPAATVVGLLAAAAAADAVWLWTGRLRPISINRQVPREWGRLLSAPVTAALYGARLGAGPFTMLSTWLWWAGTVASAVVGVWVAVLFGVIFAGSRVLTTVGSSLWAEGSAHQQRFSRLRSMERSGRSAIAVAVVGGLLLGACSPDRPTLSGVSTSAIEPETANMTVETERTVVVTEPEATRITPAPTPAEDAAPENSLPEAPEEAAPTPDTDASLASALIEAVPGFELLEDPIANRSLDIDAAANIQPDPSEERPLLETRGFSQGWTRAFRNDARDVVVATVYEFRDETEAAFYLEDGLITIGGYGGEFFDLPDMEGARGFRQDEGTADEPLTSVGVTFVQGSKWFLLYMVGAAETLDPEIVIEAARQQAARAN